MEELYVVAQNNINVAISRCQIMCKKKNEDVRELPPVRREQQVYDMVVELSLGAQVRIDHLADRGRAVYA